ncbi:MAG: hypothetical protein HOP29_06395 [Phycisphaerales bacterium]|nr:hypothetical protein [Phycisphaerales bacterium]
MVNIVKMNGESPRRRRRRRLRSIVVLPTLLTLGNLLCGFAAIHFSMRETFSAGAGVDASVQTTLNSALIERILPSFLAIGAILVFVGMLLDMLDGLAARLTGQASPFGAELDSLADIVTFGAAPATLALALILREWDGELVPTPLSHHAVGRAIWVCAAMYCVCAAIRLARYNVEHDRPDSSPGDFRGLPSPGAAAVVVSLVTLHEHVGAGFGSVILAALPFVLLSLGFLMTGRIRYVRVAQVLLIRRRPFGHLIVLLVVFGVCLLYQAQTLAVLCGLYALSGPVLSVARRWGWVRPGVLAAESEVDESDDTDSAVSA